MNCVCTAFIRPLRALAVAGAAWLATGCGDVPDAAPAPPPTPDARGRGEVATYEPPATWISGRWRTYRTHRYDVGLSAEQRELVEQLEGIGYLDGSQSASAQSGVSLYNAGAAHAGLNLYVSGHAPDAILMDMEGRVLHRWHHEFFAIWPDYPVEKVHPSVGYFRRAHLFPNGDLLAIFEGLGIVKLDAASRVLWANPVRAHHDLDVRPNGDVWLLVREAHVVPRIHPRAPIVEDFVVVLDAEGRETRRFSLLEALERSDWSQLVPKGAAGDIFHTNTLEVLDGRLSGRVPAFAAGNLLISFFALDAIAVVDPDAGRIVWLRRGIYRHQHDPTVLDSGRILLFDNVGPGNASRLLELDAASGEPVWQYGAGVGEPFFSKCCGTAQRLPDGNTLVTESDNGRAFEIDAQGRVVWEFRSPHRAGSENQYVATLFEVRRLPADFPLAWAQSADQASAPQAAARGSSGPSR